MVMQEERPQIFIESGICGRPQPQGTLFARPPIRQRPAPDLFQLIRERAQRKPQRLLERVPKPSRALRLQLVDIETDRSLQERPVEPEPGVEAGRERHGLALAPLRGATPLSRRRG